MVAMIGILEVTCQHKQTVQLREATNCTSLLSKAAVSAFPSGPKPSGILRSSSGREGSAPEGRHQLFCAHPCGSLTRLFAASDHLWRTRSDSGGFDSHLTVTESGQTHQTAPGTEQPFAQRHPKVASRLMTSVSSTPGVKNDTVIYACITNTKFTFTTLMH